jgi:hypothetical protein
VKTLQYLYYLHPFKNADKICQNPDKGMQPDGRTPAGASATSYHKNIKALVPGYPHTALLDTVESGSCNYESVSTDTVDSNKGSVDSHIVVHGNLSNLKDLIAEKSLFIY